MKLVKNELIEHVTSVAIQHQNAYLPLDKVTLPTAPTNAAAYYLNRKPQTLRAWACLENGPIRPVRINGRLAWPIASIRLLLTGGK